MAIEIDVSKAPTPPTRPTYTSPRGIAAKEDRRGQARFHKLVLAKDGNKCVACGRRRDELAGAYPDLRMLIADHITPLVLGGSNDPANGQTHCFFCDVILKQGWRYRYAQHSGESSTPTVQGE